MDKLKKLIIFNYKIRGRLTDFKVMFRSEFDEVFKKLYGIDDVSDNTCPDLYRPGPEISRNCRHDQIAMQAAIFGVVDKS